MSNPADQDIGWRAIWRINFKFASGLLALGYGWLCWQGESPEYWGYWVIAVFAFAGGALQMVVASVEATRLVLRLRRWKKYQRLGSKPRADNMARDRDFASYGNDSGGKRP